jgi:hypothetical protein
MNFWKTPGVMCPLFLVSDEKRLSRHLIGKGASELPYRRGRASFSVPSTFRRPTVLSKLRLADVPQQRIRRDQEQASLPQ